MRKRFFDVGLYADALRQLRLIGIAAFVVLELEANLLPLANWFSRQQMLTNGYTASNVPYIADLLEWHPLVLLCPFLVAPLMMLVLFHFLNKRSASDFYHVLPNTRVSLFMSFTAAIMTWVTALLLLTTATDLLMFRLFPSGGTINFPSALTLLFNLWAAALYLCMSLGIGMSLTGTLFTNIVVTVLLVFSPRLLLFAMHESLIGVLPILPPGSQPFLLDGSANVVTGLLFSDSVGGVPKSLVNPASGLYTLVLALVYGALALWLFCRRPSETAGKSAPNRIVQAAFRLVPAMLFCLIPCSMIIGRWFDSDSGYDMELFEYLILYIVAIGIYFLYELVTTRKWRNLWRAVPGLGILAALNLVLIGSAAGVYSSALSYHPEAEEIESVRILQNNANDYFVLRSSAIELTDDAIREIVAEQLDFAVTDIRQAQRIWFGQKQPSSLSGETYTWHTVAIKTAAGTAYRRIPLTAGDLAVITERLEANDEYRRIYMELPRLGENGLQVSVSGLDDEKARELYAIAREEIAGLDFSLWYACINGSYNQAEITASGEAQTSGVFSLPASLSASGYQGAQSYSFHFSLYSFLPKTCEQYLAWYNEEQSAQDFFERLSNASGEDNMVSIAWYGTASGESYVNFPQETWPAFLENNGQALRESLESMTAPRMDHTLLRITVEEYGENGYYTSTDIYCNASESLQAALQAYMESTGELQTVFTVD